MKKIVFVLTLLVLSTTAYGYWESPFVIHRNTSITSINQNVTQVINITNNITTIFNTTNNITQNFTTIFNITNNITTTFNITNNETVNITNNITEFVSQPVLADNVTQGIFGLNFGLGNYSFGEKLCVGCLDITTFFTEFPTPNLIINGSQPKLSFVDPAFGGETARLGQNGLGDMILSLPPFGTAEILLDRETNDVYFQKKSVVIKNDTGYVGIGEGLTDPLEKLHVRDGNLLLEADDASISPQIIWNLSSLGQAWKWNVNNNTGRITINDITSGNGVFKLAPGAVNNAFRIGITDSETIDFGNEVFVNAVNGNIDTDGNVTADDFFTVDTTNDIINLHALVTDTLIQFEEIGDLGFQLRHNASFNRLEFESLAGENDIFVIDRGTPQVLSYEEMVLYDNAITDECNQLGGDETWEDLQAMSTASNGGAHWSLGNNVQNASVTVLCDGYFSAMSINCRNAGAGTSGQVEVTVNGVENSACSVASVSSSSDSNIDSTCSSVTFNEGDIIGLKTTASDASDSSCDVHVAWKYD